jgi:hypothetical protein
MATKKKTKKKPSKTTGKKTNKKTNKKKRGRPGTGGGTTIIVEPGGGGGGGGGGYTPLTWTIEGTAAIAVDAGTANIGSWATTDLLWLAADVIVGGQVIYGVQVFEVRATLDVNGVARAFRFQQHTPGRWRFTLGGAILHAANPRNRPRWNADLMVPLQANTTIEVSVRVAQVGQAFALTWLQATRVEWKFR